MSDLEGVKLAVTVKQLEWVGDDAKTPFGRYSVERSPDGYAAIFGGFEELAHVGFNAVDPLYGARRAAQDHAQADYERRILSALSPSPVPAPLPGSGETALWQRAAKIARHMQGQWRDQGAYGEASAVGGVALVFEKMIEGYTPLAEASPTNPAETQAVEVGK